MVNQCINDIQVNSADVQEMLLQPIVNSLEKKILIGFDVQYSRYNTLMLITMNSIKVVRKLLAEKLKDSDRFIRNCYQAEWRCPRIS
jgi:hypothetical protein